MSVVWPVVIWNCNVHHASPSTNKIIPSATSSLARLCPLLSPPSRYSCQRLLGIRIRRHNNIWRRIRFGKSEYLESDEGIFTPKTDVGLQHLSGLPLRSVHGPPKLIDDSQQLRLKEKHGFRLFAPEDSQLAMQAHGMGRTRFHSVQLARDGENVVGPRSTRTAEGQDDGKEEKRAAPREQRPKPTPDTWNPSTLSSSSSCLSAT